MNLGGSESEEEREARPRPRVVDKRVSAGGFQGPPPSRTDSPVAPPGTETPETTSQAGHTSPQPPPGGGVWTPEQEAEAMAMARQVVETPSLEWVVNSAVNLANIAATKLDMGAATDASLVIDALAGMLKEVGHRLGDVEQPLKQTLAQLQMAYTERVMSPGAPPPGRPPQG